MKLKSFGCSFIYGVDLDDIIVNNLRIGYSNKTWPALYAKELNYTYQCYAHPGVGNLRIAEQVLNQAADTDPALYVIGWTWIDRFDYTKDVHNNLVIDSKWQTILPVNEDELAKTYYRDIHSEYRDKLTTLINIKLVIDTLKQKNLSFIMTCMDDLTFDTRWHSSPAVKELQKYISPYMTQFKEKSFLEWSRNHGYPESPHWHPLEQAHAAAAKYMLELGVYKK